MANFCTECGSSLEVNAKFCANCGAPRASQSAVPPANQPANPETPAPASAPSPAHAPVQPTEMPRAEAQPETHQSTPNLHDPKPYDSGSYDDAPYETPPSNKGPSNKGKAIIIAAFAVAALAVIILAVYMFREPPPAEEEAEADTPSVTAQAEDPNAPRPQDWFDNYSDKFLSADLTRLTKDSAAKRNFPTALGSKVLENVDMGVEVSGRWVEGADASTRWLKTTDGGYIWEGNLSKLETITSAGMFGIKVNTPFSELKGKVNPLGNYSAEYDDWDSESCEIYSSDDDLINVMVENGKVTFVSTGNPKLSTAKNIKVGSSESDLRKAYGSKLKSEENPYDGTDYFLWETKGRGIKFHVSEGKVIVIVSGTDSIRYVEGCL